MTQPLNPTFMTTMPSISLLRSLGVLAFAMYTCDALGEESILPSTFEGLSIDESVVSCAQFFSYSAELQIEAIHLTRKNQDFKKELRKHIQMKTTLLLYDIDKIPKERRDLAKSAINSDVNKTPSDVIDYCFAVYDKLHSTLTPQLREKVVKYSETEAQQALNKRQ